MRVVFAGTPAFAASALASIVDAGHDVVLVLTRADRAAGRGQSLRESAVKQVARERGLPLEQPRTLRDEQLQQRLRDAQADVMVVAAYGALLPREVLGIPRHGCLNIHASLLPRWRGAAPIQRAIESGDPQTGITIMRMDEGLDTGPMLLAVPEPIHAQDTAGSLHDRLASLGARTIVEALDALAKGTLVARAQPSAGVTYAAKIVKSDEAIDWALPGARIVDRVRAFDPTPGCTATIASPRPATVKIWRARTAPESASAHSGAAAAHRGTAPAYGTVLSSAGRLLVACGDGAVELLELQKPGGRRLPVVEFLRGFPIPAGARFVPPQPTA